MLKQPGHQHQHWQRWLVDRMYTVVERMYSGLATVFINSSTYENATRKITFYRAVLTLSTMAHPS